jgi:hypothetical protein
MVRQPTLLMRNAPKSFQYHLLLYRNQLAVTREVFAAGIVVQRYVLSFIMYNGRAVSHGFMEQAWR